MPEARDADLHKIETDVIVNEATFRVVYNPFAITVGDSRAEESLLSGPIEEMTGEQFVRLTELRARMLARQIVSWDVTAFGVPVPPHPDAILEALDPLFIATFAASRAEAGVEGKEPSDATSSSNGPAAAPSDSPPEARGARRGSRRRSSP